MSKLWKKSDTTIHPAVEKYTAGTDYLFDQEVLPFDIVGTRAHVKGLESAGVLSAGELQQTLAALDALEKDFTAGSVHISPEDEDCHTVLENYLVAKIGEVGKKVHTGRSRNDQVLTATRLYMKHHLGALKKQCVELATSFVDYADKQKDVPMPGYSHTQQGMLSSVGHYMLAHAEALLDDADFIDIVSNHMDKSPLGSAAGFGVSIPLKREMVAKELGFAKLQVNSLYAQNSRGKFESAYMEALAQVMLTLGKFANDMLLFTSQEFDYFSVDASLTTGSSIMPHKHNLDAMEILRGNVSVVIANQLMIKDIAKNLLSGYNRDGQLMKKPLIESTHIVQDSIEIAGLVLQGLSPKPDSIRAKINPGIFTADIANDMVQQQGVAFRDAYKAAADMRPEDVDLQKNLASKVSLGGPGNLYIEGYRNRIEELRE